MTQFRLARGKMRTMRLLLASIVVLLALPAPGRSQRVLLVDASGQSGQYRTIMKAVKDAKQHDLILVRKGTYVENVVVDSRSVNILGIEPNPKDVVLQAPASNVAALTVRNHPVGHISRFSRLTIKGTWPYPSIQTSSTKGDLLFELVETTDLCRFSKHDGVLSLSGCRMTSRQTVLNAIYVKHLLCHDCFFLTSAVNSYLTVTPGVMIMYSDVHLSHCTANGSQGGKYLIVAYAGGPALWLQDSTARVSGIASDTFTGGNGVMTGGTTRTSLGGPGILLHSSQLTISAVTVQGGLGRLLGGPIQRTAPIVTSGSRSIVVSAVPPMPTVSVQAAAPPLKMLSRGAKSDVVIHATPNALSLTWIAIDFQPYTTPWGLSVIDLTKPAIMHKLTHGTNGNASFALDLRGLPATFVGAPYAVQTLAADSSNRISLSGPRLGVIGF